MPHHTLHRTNKYSLLALGSRHCPRDRLLPCSILISDEGEERRSTIARAGQAYFASRDGASLKDSDYEQRLSETCRYLRQSGQNCVA